MQVSFGARIAGALHAATPRLGPMLARLESKTLSDEVALPRGDEAQAAAFHEQALKLDPTFPLAMRWLADMLFDRRDFAGALVQYKRAIEKNPRDFRARIQAGLAARYTNDAPAALDYFVRAGKASREGWQAFYNEACLHAVREAPDGGIAAPARRDRARTERGFARARRSRFRSVAHDAGIRDAASECRRPRQSPRVTS
jgi:tetratricopeptide (TPR) repeat protein